LLGVVDKQLPEKSCNFTTTKTNTDAKKNTTNSITPGIFFGIDQSLGESVYFWDWVISCLIN
jgi:hypothetical protein